MFERWEEHRELFGRIKAPEWKTPPLEIFERQMMVTVEACEESDVRIALEFLSADHIAIASDWPHYDGTPELLEGFQKVSRSLDPADAQNIATGTLERWFPSH
jgi:predicted TIM-barrel fold metal-dependent hydrolase